MIKSNFVISVKKRKPTVDEIERSVDDRWGELVDELEAGTVIYSSPASNLLGWVQRQVVFVAGYLRIEGHNNG